ncbi:MAG: ferrous iron transport protein A [Planctomycetaceae bacterium]|jgi:Fe2+ transport system protein FeoA|nr:ferrous iron transport protein A [Planctomycetaceae bacterium]
MTTSQHTVTTIAELRVGESATVIAVYPDSASDNGSLVSRLAGMGIFPETKISIRQASRSGKRPTIVAIGDTRIALGHEVAEMISVSRN